MRANHIMSLFLVHLSWCKAQGKDPEHGPLNVVWLPQAKLPALLLPDRQLGVGATDEDLQVVEGNGGEVREIVDQGGRRQMLIGWGDWSAYPKAYQEVVAVATLFCQRFMKEAKPMAAETVEQYLGPNRFLTPEGTVLQKGNFLALSIDGFLEQKGETK
jgi:hypothetical protein